MPEKDIVQHCSPTLAGIKTGSLFLCSYESEAGLRRDITQWNTRLGTKGVRFAALRARNGKALIYTYRVSRLKEALSNAENASFLAENGYPADHLEECLACLSERLSDQKNFPHEIGVFLGYPLDDIKAFIANGGANCKCVGCWKVYSNEQAAKKTFIKYKKCTQIYCRKYAAGVGVDRLTVAL
ncbi:MAG TPA: DUF3793 family protein [Eubacteriales bacterium]|nr:DUF3793 family protein [Eubacteriales bacterium]